MNTAIGYMGPAKASNKSKVSEVLAKVAGADKITHIWGYSPDKNNTEHHSGLASDFMVFNDKALGDRIYSYLWDNRVRLGVQHIIWQQSITSTVVEPGVRRHMADRGNATENHMDHVHVLFFDKEYQSPGVPTKQPKPNPQPSTSIILKSGSTGQAVKNLQTGLNKHFPLYSHLSADGVFGSNTKSVVMSFQSRSGLMADGIVGSKTRVALAKYGITF